MTELGRLLVSLQLADSAFPIGMYTMSHGLEGFAQCGLLDGARARRAGAQPPAGAVDELLADVLVALAGPGDATALARAHEAATAGDWDGVVAVDHLLFASKLNAELRTASVRSGRQLIGLAVDLFDEPAVHEHATRIRARTTPGCQAVVSAVCHAAAGSSAAHAVTADLFAFANSFVGAALRLRLTDHRRAQVTLRRAAPLIETVALAALDRPLDDLGGFAPLADIASATHERAEARLFTS
ncbi:MAG: urease accessory UreF family protein [Ilumatobacteraceae bacterium]